MEFVKVRDLEESNVFSWRRYHRPLKMKGYEFILPNVSKIDPIKESYNFATLENTEMEMDSLVITGIGFMSFPVTGYYGFFKPTEKEVLERLPEKLLPDIDYYWLDSRHMDRSNLIDDGNTQVCEIWLFKDWSAQ